jgi:ribosomal protein S18 acetylase RimI-like enzyme
VRRAVEVSICPANAGDAQEIARIRILTWRAAYHGIVPQEILDSFDFEEEGRRWQETLANMTAERGAFVARIEGTRDPACVEQRRLAGYCFCGTERSQDPEYDAEIYALYVLPEHQGQGIGRALVQAAMDWLIGQGLTRMLIYVLRENRPARRFYEAVGGSAVREKTVEIRGAMMVEVGYGYDLAKMAGE